MIYGSVCSGIEAVTVAWHPLGWKAAFFAEIDPFCNALLKHYYPEVPNYGDFTQIERSEPIDLLVGGTPCQDFSVAGLRKGMDGARGQLTVEFLGLVGRLRPRWVVWENVPGVLSIDKGRAFGMFLGRLGELGYGFAYRVLDAQYFGVPQQRRRVFVVGYLGDWRRAAAVLFERESLRGDPAPGRAARKSVAACLADSSRNRGLGLENEADNIVSTLESGANRTGGPRPPGTTVDITEYLIPRIAWALQERDAKGVDSDTKEGHLIITPPLTGSGRGVARTGESRGQDPLVVTHALRADGFDASEDGTGRGTPLIPIDMRQASRGAKLTNKRAHGSGGAPGHGVGREGDPAFTVSERGQAIAFNATGGSRDVQAGRLSPSLRVGGHSHPSAVAFESRYARNGRGAPSDIVPPLKAQSGETGKGDAAPLIFTQNTRDEVRLMEKAVRFGTIQDEGQRKIKHSGVRRLTPTECARLQGFPDDYLDIEYRGKPAADGPKYRALGNSMAVPVMSWIGQRIQMVEDHS